MPKSDVATQVQRMPRQGEGAVVELARRQVTQPDGSTALELNLDLSMAPVPEKRYVADIASLIYEDDVVQLLFGQKKVGRHSGLRSLIVVQMTSTAASHFLRCMGLWGPSARRSLDRNTNGG